MFSVGLGITEQYRLAEKCIVNITTLSYRFEDLVKTFQQSAASIDLVEVWVDSTLALGNVSWTYKGCYLTTQGSLTQLYYKVLSYKSVENYMLYLLPNMLSYAFVVNQWITRMENLQKAGNVTGLAYYYGMIIRDIFFFDIPETASYTLGSARDGRDQQMQVFIALAESVRVFRENTERERRTTGRGVRWDDT